MAGNLEKDAPDELAQWASLHRKVQVLEILLIVILVLCLCNLTLNAVNFYSLLR